MGYVKNQGFVFPVDILNNLSVPCFLGQHDTLSCVLIL